MTEDSQVSHSIDPVSRDSAVVVLVANIVQ
jgi:hypothetical protein